MEKMLLILQNEKSKKFVNTREGRLSGAAARTGIFTVNNKKKYVIKESRRAH